MQYYQLTVGKLIEELKKQPEDAVVFFHCDGTRYEASFIDPVDNSFYDDHRFVDINLIT